MDHPNYFRSNLHLLKDKSQLSLTKFSELVQIPRATMQSVLKDGQTSLDTACRISNALRLPLSALTSDLLLSNNIDVLQSTLIILDWYDCLSAMEQTKVRIAFTEILEVLQK